VHCRVGKRRWLERWRLRNFSNVFHPLEVRTRKHDTEYGFWGEWK